MQDEFPGAVVDVARAGGSAVDQPATCVVLVTGGAGFIGSFVVDRLLAGGHAVRVLDSLDPQVHPEGARRIWRRTAELVRATCGTRRRCARPLDGVDAVVHAPPPSASASPSTASSTTSTSTSAARPPCSSACEDARRHLRKLLVFTSMTGYGEGVYRRRRDGRLLRVGDPHRGGHRPPRLGAGLSRDRRAARAGARRRRTPRCWRATSTRSPSASRRSWR